MTKSNWKRICEARRRKFGNMPRLRHSIAGEPFDLKRSELAQWLAYNDDAFRILFDALGKSGAMPLQDEALAIAQELLALGPPEYRACVHAWARVRAIIGRPDVRVHDLRHSRASALARNGASLPQIGKLLGHASHATTNRYMHLVDRDLRDLVERTS